MRRTVRLACMGTLLSTTMLSTAYAASGGVPATVVAQPQTPVLVAQAQTGTQTQSSTQTPVLLAQAQTGNPVLLAQAQTLSPVTVYATRSPQSTFDVPAMVSIVDADAPATVLAADLNDLLDFVPGVQVLGGTRARGQSISVRGFNDSQIITLIDGRRQNFQTGHNGSIYIDPSLLKSVEIVKGASSSIYGGGAIGGVVAFETNDAADLLEPGQTLGAMASLAYRSANNEFVPTMTGFGRAGGFDLLGSVSYRNSGDIDLGNDTTLQSDSQMLSGLFKVGYSFNDFHTIKFQAAISSIDDNEPANGQSGDDPDTLSDKTIEDRQFSLKYSFDNPANQWLSPKLHLYYNDTSIDTEGLANTNNDGRIRTRELDTIGFTADNQSKLSFGGGTQKHTLSYGFEIYHDKQETKSTDAAVGNDFGGAPNAEQTTWGLYLQDEISLTTGIGEFLVIPAVRFDQYDSENAAGSLSQDENAISPKIAMSYRPIESLLLFGSWAQAFRAPSINEIYPSGVHFSIPGPGGSIVNNFIENPDLKPETVTTIELGAGVDFDNLLGKDDLLQIKGSWYTSEGEDFIDQFADEPTRAHFVPPFAGPPLFTGFFNVANATIEGWEVSGQYQFYPVTAKVGLSYVDGKNDDTGESLGVSQPLTLLTDLSYQIDRMDAVIGWRARYADKADNDTRNTATTATAGYGVHDLYFRFSPDDLPLILDVGVENLFDKAYERRYAAVFEEGRSYVVRGSYKW